MNRRAQTQPTRPAWNLTLRAVHAIALANQWCDHSGRKALAPDFVLLVLLYGSYPSAEIVLRALGIERRDLHVLMSKALNATRPESGSPILPRTERFHRAVARASDEAQRSGHDKGDTAFLLLGMLTEASVEVCHLLEKAGLTAGDVRTTIPRIIPAGFSPEADTEQMNAMRAAEQRRRIAEQRRREQLFAQACGWDEAQRIRRFVEHIRAEAAAHHWQTISGVPLDQWIAWAERQADALDPTDAIVEAPPSSTGQHEDQRPNAREWATPKPTDA